MKPGRLAAVFLVATAFVFYLGCACISIPHALVLVLALLLSWRPTNRIVLGLALVVAILVIIVGVIGLAAAIVERLPAWMLVVAVATLVLGFAVGGLAARAMFWRSTATGSTGPNGK